MSLTIAGTKTALTVNNTASFGASGGTSPYTFSVAPYEYGVSGAGGTIDSSTGLYTAPATVQNNPRNYYDTVIVTDSSSPSLTAQTTILVGYPWMMIADILRVGMGLSLDRVWFFDQKVDMPKDGKMFLTIGLPRQKPLASNLAPAGIIVGSGGPGWNKALVWTQISGTIDIHVQSRELDAINQMPRLFRVLQGPYSRNQQRACGLYLAKLPQNSVDVSGIDGAAIPYHFVVSVEAIWTQSEVLEPEYWDTFPTPQVTYIQH